MFWSTFTAYMTANKSAVPAAEWAAIVREGKARYVARLQSGRADSALTFDDLIRRAETLIAGA